MPMTLDEIVEAASHLPREQLAEVVDRLTSVLHAGVDSATKNEQRRSLTVKLA